jgi:hypothetical protein
MFKFLYTGIDKINPIKRLRSKGKIEAIISKKSRFSHFETLLNDGQLSTLTNEEILKELASLYDPNYNDVEEDDDEDNNEDDEYEYENKVQIPFLLLLFVIVLYIMSGAYLFQYFENWELSQTAYFVFVTLSTVGFGDFVPGQESNDPRSNIKLIAIAFYSLFGMSIIGMCFRLVQRAAVRTFRKVIFKLKRFFNPAKKIETSNMTESDREKEKQDILGRIKLLQSFEGTVRKRNV